MKGMIQALFSFQYGFLPFFYYPLHWYHFLNIHGELKPFFGFQTETGRVRLQMISVEIRAK
jgi:hypothetical protein